MVFNLATRYESTPNSELAANHTLYELVRASQIMFIKVEHGSGCMSLKRVIALLSYFC